MSGHDVCQRVGAVDHGTQRTPPGQSRDGTEVVGPEAGTAIVDRGVGACRSQNRAPVTQSSRALAPSDGIQHPVVAVLSGAEILDRVVDHMLGAQVPYQVQVRGAAHSRDGGAQQRGHLHHDGTDRARGPIDQHILPAADASLAQVAEREQAAIGKCSGLPVRELLRTPGQQGVVWPAHVFGISPEAVPVEAEDLVADLPGPHG